MPGPRKGIGEEIRQGESIKCLAFNTIMCRDDTHQDLDQDQAGNHPKVLERCPHRCRHLQTEKWILLQVFNFFFIPGFYIIPGKKAYPGKNTITLKPVHKIKALVGVLPTNFSDGQLFV